MKQIQIRVYPNGEIEAETFGIKGKKCLKYLKEVEALTDAKTNDSEFTKEYLETEVSETVSDEMEEII